MYNEIWSHFLTYKLGSKLKKTLFNKENILLSLYSRKNQKCHKKNQKQTSNIKISKQYGVNCGVC